jgi:carbamoyl-phosphate synthase large subunit
MNILLFPSDTEIAREVYESLKNNKEYTLLAGTSNSISKSDFLDFNEVIYVPHVTHISFTERVLEIVDMYKVDYIFPCHDDVCLKLSQLLPDKTIGHNFTVNEICRSKSSTYKYFNDCSFVPNQKNLQFPIFVKPDKGNGSKGAQIINTQEELDFYNSKSICEIVTTEYLPGKEYTVDCFTSKGELLFVGARTRESSTNGISDIGFEVTNQKINDLANKINNSFSGDYKLDGAWFFQLKKDLAGELKLLEIGPRISGGMAFYRMKGVNFSELSILTKLGVTVEVKTNNIKEISFCKFFTPKFNFNKLPYSNIYVDFDDTLYLHKQKTINTDLVKLLFQGISEGRKIYLITRSIHDYCSILKTYKLDGIWDNIIHMPPNEEKKDYINPYSVFIDDSFSERNFVKDNVWCFDLHNFNILIK